MREPGGRRLVGNATGLAVRRLDLPRGLDFLRMRLSGHEFPRHVHEGYSIGLVHRGWLEYWHRSTIEVRGPGSLILMNPGEVHTGRARPGTGPVRYDVMFPTADLVEALIGRAPRLARSESRDPVLARALRRLARAAESGATDAESLLREVLARALHDPGAAAEDLPPRQIALAAMVKDFLHRNLRGRPTLRDLARTAGVHPGYLRRVFGDVTGLSPRSYLLQLRVMRARQLLGKGQPIARVVAAAGFADQAHLTHEFKRTMGVPPGGFLRALGYRP